MKLIFTYLILSSISFSLNGAEEEETWKTNYQHPRLFEEKATKTSTKKTSIDPWSAEVTGYLLEIHNEQSADKLQSIVDAFHAYSSERTFPLELVINGSSSKVFYLKKDALKNQQHFYDQFGKTVAWMMLNRQDSLVTIRPILEAKNSPSFDPDRSIWMEPAPIRKGNQKIRIPESAIIDGFHIHVDYLTGQHNQAMALKEQFLEESKDKKIFYSALDSYPEKINGPHVRAGWELKFEKAGPTVFDHFGYSLAWVLLNHQDLPVYSHAKTWIYGENEERLASHIDSALYMGALPDLDPCFFYNPELNISGLYRWDVQLPFTRSVSSQESLAKQKEILTFWFDSNNSSNEKFDQLTLDKFQKDLVLATIGAYDSWKQTPEGRLALILLLDQFPRNMFRETRMTFAYDRLALPIAKEGIEKGDDQKLESGQKHFFYLPLLRSAALSDQKQGELLQRNLNDCSNVTPPL